MRVLLWLCIAAVGAIGFGAIALYRNEPINAAWLLAAAFGTWAIGYRFYSRFIVDRVFRLDDARPTPAVRLEDGKDFVPTSKWVVFGHHFAAIAGAGPLVGPILAAQFGWLPGTLWIIVGVVVAGAVQDLVILCASIRRDGRSLAELAREELGPLAGWTALISITGILCVLIAVLAIVVVNALAESPWSVVTVGCTIPIAMLMGVWMRWLRPGRVLEASAIGLVLLFGALWLGHVVNEDPVWKARFTLGKEPLAWAVVVYGLVAAALPVWLLLAPRDYLSAFVKLGTVALLALGVVLVWPTLQMPAVVGQLGAGPDVAAGHGPVFAGTLFPFAFITIACGVISGFHSLVSSGTTPKLISRERDCRAIGYGAMLMEAFVALMALIAACALTPAEYFTMNSTEFTKQTPTQVSATLATWGMAFTPAEITKAAEDIGEPSIIAKTGGAPTLAVGMAHIFAQATSKIGATKEWWYHFAILFEALFILTTVDAGTRVGRFLMQQLLGSAHRPLGATGNIPAAWLASGLIVAGWGFFLIAGIRDPNGIKFLWPVFGIANQVLAAIALVVGTTVLLRLNAARWVWLTALPLAWLVTVTVTASWQRLFSLDAKLGFLAQIRGTRAELARVAPDGAAAVQQQVDAAGADVPTALLAQLKHVCALEQAIFNAQLDTALVAAFVLVIAVVLAIGAWTWWRIATGRDTRRWA